MPERLTIQQALDLALRQRKDGRLAEAEAIYRQLGEALAEGGQWQKAAEAFELALEIRPDIRETHFNLAVVLAEIGDLEKAAGGYRRAMAIRPQVLFPQCDYNLGVVLARLGRPEEAVAAYRRAIAGDPNMAEAHANLGDALLELNELDEAVAALGRALELKPDLAVAHANLGNVLSRVGRFDEAAAAYRRAIGLKLDVADVHNNLGVVLAKLGDLDAAAGEYRRAIVLKPDFAEGYANLGNTLASLARMDEAVGAYRQALVLKPGFVEVHYSLAGVLENIGCLDEALGEYRRTLALKPDFVVAHSSLIYSLHLSDDQTGDAILAEARRWDARHAEPLRKSIVGHLNQRDPGRRLRIGYVSDDFREHPVGRFLQALFQNHDHERFEIFCYSDVAKPDRMTRRLRAGADHWKEISSLSNESGSELIRADAIDILVDLAGHTGGGRLMLFAHKPAPVQISYLGHPGTTGLATMDYRLTDGLADPAGLIDRFYSEALLRLPRTNWCFTGPENSPEVAPSPVLERGVVCFGSLNRLSKATPRIFDLWARILGGMPGSRLLLKDRVLADEKIQDRVRRDFALRGIDPKRLELIGLQKDFASHLDVYARVDIALDTFPYHGTTTTCEALWMGVPVVTLAGETHVSRVSVSLLTNIGLMELIAKTPDEYVSIATSLVLNHAKLIEWRGILRSRMAASPLMDGAGFARDVEAAYRLVWGRWCDAYGH